eukprot:1747757-Pleurochrysis_carterae.AAC.1
MSSLSNINSCCSLARSLALSRHSRREHKKQPRIHTKKHAVQQSRVTSLSEASASSHLAPLLEE